MGVRIVDIRAGLIQLHAVVVKLAADGVNLAIEYHGGKLVAGHRHGSGVGPGRRTRCPVFQIEHPVIVGIGVSVCHESAEVMQRAIHHRQSASSARFRKQRRRRVAIQVDIITPDLGDGVTPVPILESAGKPHGSAIQNHVHVRDSTGQFLNQGPTVVRRIENLRALTGDHPIGIAPEDIELVIQHDHTRFPFSYRHIRQSLPGARILGQAEICPEQTHCHGAVGCSYGNLARRTCRPRRGRHCLPPVS